MKAMTGISVNPGGDQSEKSLTQHKIDFYTHQNKKRERSFFRNLVPLRRELTEDFRVIKTQAVALQLWEVLLVQVDIH